MENNNSKASFYFLVFVSVFIVLFFARDYFYDITTNLDNLDTKKQELTEKKNTLKKLELLNSRIKDKNNKFDDVAEIEKYTHEVKEDELLDYFHSYVLNSRSGSGYILINNITFDKGVKNEYGFTQGKIDLNLTVSDEQELFKILDFVVNKDSYYKFFIDNFSFPNDKQAGAFTVSIPLKVFYK